ncbi:hypothetical protein N7326_02330 [Corynebacterium sp. ES2794-CONJ1]|nr:hypothetical protein [Corynebacterium sp. ES2794-CONJ1]MCU9518711.1 hypothetical protein [Corynebacterium sp. ES2794-CONJ1]
MSLERTAPDEYFTDFDPEAFAKKFLADAHKQQEEGEESPDGDA